MTAAQRMDARATLHNRLVILDHELTITFGRAASNRNSAFARELLRTRQEICDAMILVGYQPWELSSDARVSAS